MLSLSRAIGRRLFSSAEAASTAAVRTAQNPLEEFFEVERSTEEGKPPPHYDATLLGDVGYSWTSVHLKQTDLLHTLLRIRMRWHVLWRLESIIIMTWCIWKSRNNWIFNETPPTTNECKEMFKKETTLVVWCVIELSLL